MTRAVRMVVAAIPQIKHFGRLGASIGWIHYPAEG